MNVLGMLRKLGDRLGVVEMSDSPKPAVPAKIQTRKITLSELTMTIQVTDVQSLAESPAGLLSSFEDVFKAAGIVSPPGGWSIDRLCEFLASERVQGLDRTHRQQEILGMLAAETVDAAAVVRDAVSRDQALDAFADSVSQKRQRWLAEKKQEIRTIEEGIAAEEKQWKEWRQKKRQRERDMAHAVEYLIDKPVISIDDE